MITLKPEYVIDADKVPKAVLLSMKEWNNILEALEELDDIRAYDRAKSKPQDAIPIEQAVREIQEKY
jgi:PHD/YefM family antitoxin component YafN of YafNO toxin-antitoxin module